MNPRSTLAFCLVGLYAQGVPRMTRTQVGNPVGRSLTAPSTGNPERSACAALTLENGGNMGICGDCGRTLTAPQIVCTACYLADKTQGRDDVGARIRPEALSALLVVGAVFETPFESGCVVTRPVDSLGGFVADDSDGVSCLFHPDMVVSVGTGSSRVFVERES